MFERSVEDVANVPEHKAIYKICYNGHVQNIGETNNLARRLKEKKGRRSSNSYCLLFYNE